jgi:hypothetical protein
MGLSFSFHLVCPVGAIDDVLRAFAAHLRSDDGERVMACLPWAPAVGIAALGDETMMWCDLLIERPVTDEQVRAALNVTFEVPMNEVFVIASIENFPATYGVVACAYDIPQGFRRHLSIFVRDSVSLPEELEGARSMARALGCDVLLPDATINPYINTLVHASGESYKVSVDIDEEDEHVYRVVGRWYE